MKIVSTGSTLASPEFHKKKREQRKRRRIFLSVASLLLLGLTIFLSRQERFLISAVSIDGAKTVSEENVKEIVNQRLSDYYLGLIPYSNFLLYPRKNIEQTLERKFPRFNSVSLALEGTQVLKIKVSEREPFALYCPSAAEPANASSCYFLDEEGFIFDHAPSFSGPVYFIYTSTEPLAEPLGQSFLAASDFKPLAQFIRDLPALEVHPLALEAGPEEWNLVLPGGAHIVWKRSSNLSQIYTDLSAFLKSEVIKNQPDFLNKITLLDLRTDNKVFYRFKE